MGTIILIILATFFLIAVMSVLVVAKIASKLLRKSRRGSYGGYGYGYGHKGKLLQSLLGAALHKGYRHHGYGKHSYKRRKHHGGWDGGDWGGDWDGDDD